MNTQPTSTAIAIDPASLRILIVDDEPMLRSVIHDFLEMLGYTNHTMAGDGMEALEMIRAAPTDLMLSDIRMPRMELQDVLQAVRREAPTLSVIATSGYSDFESALSIFNEGAHDFLGKPLNLNALESSLRWILERRMLLERIAALSPDTAAQTPAQLEALIAEVRSLYGAHEGCFRRNIEHCLRLQELIANFDLGLDQRTHGNLRLAALLHESGMSYYMHATCHEPRKFDLQERRLFALHTRNSAQFAGRALNHNAIANVINGHLAWQQTSANDLDGWHADELAAIWLGLFNTIDGCLQPRPDRASIPLASIRQSLERRRGQFPAVPLVALLDQGTSVETFYGENAEPND